MTAEARMLATIAALTASGTPPSRRQLATAMGLELKTVENLLRRVRARGLVAYIPLRTPSLRVTTAGRSALQEVR